MRKKSEIDNAMLIAAEVFNGEYTWWIGSCLTSIEEEEIKEATREAFITLRKHGISYKEVKLHVERHEARNVDPVIRFIDRQWGKCETEELLF